MRHQRPLLVILACVLIGLGMVASATSGSTRLDAAPGEHPVVGAWLVATNVDNPANPAAWALFGANGTFLRNSPVDGIGVGAWQATGARTATLTIFIPKPGAGGQGETQVTRATIAVEPGGDRLTSVYTLEIVGSDGIGRGQYGPGLAEGKRIVAEPMGTPIGPLGEATVP
jgi:hypothetical protein